MSSTALDTAIHGVTAHWSHFPDDDRQELAELLATGIEAAANNERQTITVMNPTSRPVPLRLSALATDTSIDGMYQQEWCEFSIDSAGKCYLVYRRRDGQDYCVGWSSATSLPETLQHALPPILALALLSSDG